MHCNEWKFLLPSYRLCSCRLVIVMLLLVDYVLCGCSLVIAISLRESFRLCRYNALTSLCYQYNSLSFETVKVKYCWYQQNIRLSQFIVTYIDYWLIILGCASISKRMHTIPDNYWLRYLANIWTVKLKKTRANHSLIVAYFDNHPNSAT